MFGQLFRLREVVAGFHRESSRRDLMEYALLAALIGLAAAIGLGIVAGRADGSCFDHW